MKIKKIIAGAFLFGSTSLFLVACGSKDDNKKTTTAGGDTTTATTSDGGGSTSTSQGGGNTTTTSQGGGDTTSTSQGGGNTTTTSQGGGDTTSTSQGGGNTTTTSQGGGNTTTTTEEAQPRVRPDNHYEYNVYYASPDGSLSSDGTSKDNPGSIYVLKDKLLPGDTLYLLPGVYRYSSRINIGAANPEDEASWFGGKQGAYINIRPENETDKVIFDFSAMPFDGNMRGIQVYGDFYHFYNIDIRGAGDNGMYIAGDHNIVEKCNFYDNRDSGLQLGRSKSSQTTLDQWPSYNLIKNCTSFGNYDDGTFGENADGFAAKLTVGYGNVFDGCIAFRNSDDGWDLYAKQDSGNIGTITIKNCVSFENGFLPYALQNNDGTTTYNTRDGDGIGFKLGGSTMRGNVVIENSMAFNNKFHGISDNSNPGVITVRNCTTFDNCIGLNADGTVSDVRGIPGDTNKSNNIDIARAVDNVSQSYNHYYGVLSYLTNQRGYNIAAGDGDSTYNKDAFRGSMAYSILNTDFDKDTHKEVYRYFTAPTDASSWVSEDNDVAFSYGSVYTGLNDDCFASLEKINMLCESRSTQSELLTESLRFRNEDYSINMHDTLRIVDETLLTFCEGESIGATLNKNSYDEYEHATFYTFEDEKTINFYDEEVAVFSAYAACDPITDIDKTFQDFDLPKLLGGCDVEWESENPDVIAINNNETSTISNSFFSKGIVTIPSETTVVLLRAKITKGASYVYKTFYVTVYGRNRKLGSISSTNTLKEIRADKYSIYNNPRIFALDDSSISQTELPKDYYTLDISYEFALEAKSGATYYAVDGVSTSVPGVYRVTCVAREVANPNVKSTYVYYVYVVDPQCTISFDGAPNVSLMPDGVVIDATLTNVEGYVAALPVPTGTTVESAYDLIHNEDALFFKVSKTNTEAQMKFIIDETHANFNLGNGYKVYYTVINDNEYDNRALPSDAKDSQDQPIFKNVNATGALKEFDVTAKNISTIAEFKSLARTGKLEDETAVSTTTIYNLTADLDFTGYDYSEWLGTNDTNKAFQSLFNGQGHKISNFNFSVASSNLDNSNNKSVNIFYRLQTGTIMNVDFENIKIEEDGGLEVPGKTKQVGIIGEMRGGFVDNVRATKVEVYTYQSGGGIIGQITGLTNTITRCSLINPLFSMQEDATREELVATFESLDPNDSHIYLIHASSKYAGGIIGNVQMNNDQSFLNLYVSNCLCIANIGDEQDSGGCVGGIVGRIKSGPEYVIDVRNNYYSGILIAYGNYNGGIIGGFETGGAEVTINGNISYAVFRYRGTYLDALKQMLSSTNLYEYAHKNSSPIVGRVTVNADYGFYKTAYNFGTWRENYSNYIGSTSLVFDLYNEDTGEEFKFTKAFLERYGFDFKNIWDLNEETQEFSLK